MAPTPRNRGCRRPSAPHLGRLPRLADTTLNDRRHPAHRYRLSYDIRVHRGGIGPVRQSRHTTDERRWRPLDPDQLGFTADVLDAVSCGDVDHCVAVGQSSDALVTTDGGLHWQLSAQLPGSDLTSVSCPDATHCWATPASGSGTPTPILRSLDGGLSWTAQTWPLPSGATGPAYLKSVDCPTPTECVALGTAETQQTIYNTEPDTSVVFTVPEALLVTTTDGSTWQAQVFNGGGGGASFALSCAKFPDLPRGCRRQHVYAQHLGWRHDVDGIPGQPGRRAFVERLHRRCELRRRPALRRG